MSTSTESLRCGGTIQPRQVWQIHYSSAKTCNIIHQRKINIVILQGEAAHPTDFWRLANSCSPCQKWNENIFLRRLQNLQTMSRRLQCGKYRLRFQHQQNQTPTHIQDTLRSLLSSPRGTRFAWNDWHSEAKVYYKDYVSGFLFFCKFIRLAFSGAH
jgi:hypothetical protein